MDFSLLYQHELYWLFLGMASFVTGVVASIAGAGGLIIMPFLIGSGVPPQVAVGTAKFSSFGLWAIALFTFSKANVIQWRYVLPMGVLGAIGGIIGANVALSLEQDKMIFVIGIIFTIIGIFSLSQRDYGAIERPTAKYKVVIGLALYLLIITFSGFFPGGMSIFIIFTLVTFMGLNALQAHATDILPWVVQTITSTAVYLMNGMIDYAMVLPLFIGLAIGGHIGSKFAVKQGAVFVKYFISILAVIIGIYWSISYGLKIFG